MFIFLRYNSLWVLLEEALQLRQNNKKTLRHLGYKQTRSLSRWYPRFPRSRLMDWQRLSGLKMWCSSIHPSLPPHIITSNIEAQPCLFLTQKPSLFEILTSHNITGASEAKWRALLEKNGSSRLKKAQVGTCVFGRWVEKAYVLQWKHVEFFQAGNGVEKGSSMIWAKKAWTYQERHLRRLLRTVLYVWTSYFYLVLALYILR